VLSRQLAREVGVTERLLLPGELGRYDQRVCGEVHDLTPLRWSDEVPMTSRVGL
jgi:hypothetical protein